jgi:glycosyltransferase involved in cell wall biosynthesis
MARFLFYDNKVINILVKEESPTGGAAVQALGWIRGLAEKGHEVFVLTDSPRDKPLKEACQDISLLPLYDHQKGIRWLRWVYYRLPYIYKQIKQVKPDYLYQGIPSWSSFLLGLVCYSLKIKFVLRISNDFLIDDRFYKSYSRTHRFFQRLGFRLASAILCQNDYQYGIIKKEYPNKKILKISNPIVLTPPTGAVDGLDRKYIGWLGLFQYQKNLKLLYEIALTLPQEQFLVAGKEVGILDAETQYYLKELKKLPNVKFAGFLSRQEVAPFLSKAKFLLNTSHYEGFSNTFLEAMSVGTPIISSHKVNPDAILTKYQLGLVFQDPEDLQQQHQSLTTERYQTLCNNAFNYVLAHHDHKELAGQLTRFLTNDQAATSIGKRPAAFADPRVIPVRQA